MGVLTKIPALILAAAIFFQGGAAAGAGVRGSAGGHEAPFEDSVQAGGFAVRSVHGATPAPEFELPGLDGRAYNIAELRGSVVLLHFWASWCVPCERETPALKRLFNDLSGSGLTILAVAEDSRKRAGVFSEEHALPFPVLIDRYGKAMRAYGIKAIPSSVVIGRDGSIRAYLIGERDYGSPEAGEFFENLLEDDGG